VTNCHDRRIQFSAEKKKVYFLNLKKAGKKRNLSTRTLGVEPGTLDLKYVHLTSTPSRGQPKDVEFCNYRFYKPKYMQYSVVQTKKMKAKRKQTRMELTASTPGCN